MACRSKSAKQLPILGTSIPSRHRRRSQEPAMPHHRGGLFVSALTAAVLLHLLLAAPPFCAGQQQYEANAQANCYGNNGSSVLGYSCNATDAAPSCTSYLTFRSAPPLYDSPVAISFLLNASTATVADANAVPTVSPLPGSRLVLAPVPCSCTPGGAYYQHNATYTIQFDGETYFIIANNTYQGLSTCQALIAQNPTHDSRALAANMSFTVPLRCACPSAAQAAAGIKYLVSYLITWNDNVPTIAARFRADYKSVLDANGLTADCTIYPFTTLLIPLKTPPTPDMLVTPPPPAPAPAAPPPPANSGGSDSGKWVGVGVGVGCGVLALGAVLGLFLLWRRRRLRSGGRPAKVVLDAPSSAEYGLASGKQTTTTTNSSSMSALMASDVRGALESLTVYKYGELERATAGFSEERRIADSSVYRAVINGDAAAVKRVAGDVGGEVGILKHVNHSSLVRLSGFCVHHGDTYLVFEFAENGALSDWLHHSDAAKGVLGWKQRVQVAFDVADGLNYLHHYTNPPYVHKNLTSSNVLLDADFRAKVSNFGLARAMAVADDRAQMTRHVVGMQGYLAPEYLEHGLISPQLDVFAFGVIVLELLSGKEAVFDGGKNGDILLWEAALGLVDGEDARAKVRAFMDPRLQGDYPADLAFAMAALALRCVAREPQARPAMDEVFVSLSAVYNSTLDWDPSDYGNSGSTILGR